MIRFGPPFVLHRLATAISWSPPCSYRCPRMRSPVRQRLRRHPPGLSLQVSLDRAGFSPGTIDGAPGRNTRAALQRFQEGEGAPAVRHARRCHPPGATGRPGPDGVHPDRRGPGRAVRRPHSRRHDGKAHTRGACLHLAGRDARRTVPHDAAPDRTPQPGPQWQAGAVLQVPNVEPFVVPAVTETRNANPPDADRVAEVRVSRQAGALLVRASTAKYCSRRR